MHSFIRGERRPALIMKTPAHSKLPACKTRVRPSTLKSSSWSVALTAQKVLRLTSWWLTNLQSLALETGLRGNRYTCSKLPARNIFKFFCWSRPVSITTESIKLPAQNTFKIGVLQLQQTRKHHDCPCSSGCLPKTLLVSYVSLVS